MTIPALLPDELAVGYLCRVARMNRLSDLRQIYALLGEIQIDCSDPDQPANMAAVLAKLADVSPAVIFTQHTLLPFTRSVRGAADCIRHCDVNDTPGRAALTYPFGRKRRLHLCSRCAREDIDFFGATYWRRSHQITGVVFCSKHGCGLRAAEVSGWSSLPEDCLSTSHALDDAIVGDALRSDVIRRYEEICSALAVRERPMPMEIVNRFIRSRTQTLCKPTSRGMLRLTPLAMEKVGGPWLRSCFPGLQEKRRAGYLDSLDRVVCTPTVPMATQYYALAMALLFGSSDEAMYRVTEAVAVASPTATKEPSRERSGQSIDKLLENVGTDWRNAVNAVLSGASIRDAAKKGGMRREDLEGLVIACAVDGLKQLRQSAH